MIRTLHAWLGFLVCATCPLICAEAAPIGKPTIYSVGQLCSLWGEVQRTTPGRPSDKLDAAEARLKSLGTIAVEGRLHDDKRGQTLFFDDDGFEGKKVVYLEFASEIRLPPAADRPVVVVGRITKVGTWIELEATRVVSDTSGWVRSTQKLDPAGLRRKAVDLKELQVERGRGIAPESIDGMYLRLRWGLSGVGGGVAGSYHTYLLLKDGWLYAAPRIAPEFLDAARSREREPDRWGKWRRDGKSVSVTWLEPGLRDPVQRLDKLIPAFAAPPGARLAGSVSALAGGGNAASGGGTSIAVTRGYQFSGDGRFTSSGAAMATTGKTGDAAPEVVTTSKAGSRAGIYELAAWGMVLRYDDGEVVPLALALMAKDDPSAIVLGQGNYTGKCVLVR